VLRQIEGVRVNGQRGPRVSHASNQTFESIEAQTLVAGLDLEGVAVSAGSACHVGSLQPSHVLRAMGLTPEQVEGSVRFSLGRFTDEEDIDAVLKTLPRLVARLRENAPVTK
jgi:cysteine desulfurase